MAEVSNTYDFGMAEMTGTVFGWQESLVQIQSPRPIFPNQIGFLQLRLQWIPLSEYNTSHATEKSTRHREPADRLSIRNREFSHFKWPKNREAGQCIAIGVSRTWHRGSVLGNNNCHPPR